MATPSPPTTDSDPKESLSSSNATTDAGVSTSATGETKDASKTSTAPSDSITTKSTTTTTLGLTTAPVTTKSTVPKSATTTTTTSSHNNNNHNNHSDNDKLKILLFGPVGNAVDVLLSKLRTLHQSPKAGPFDAAFCVGDCRASLLTERHQEIPLPIYLLDTPPEEEITPWKDDNDATTTDKDNDASLTTTTTSTSSLPVLKLAPRLFLLRNNNNNNNTDSNALLQVWSLPLAPSPRPPLVVVAVPRHFRTNRHGATLLQQLQHVSYTGCDLLLSAEWPQGVEQVLPTSSSSVENNNNNNNTTHEDRYASLVSYDVAEVALHARARYHVVPSNRTVGFCQTTTPFAHLPPPATSTNLGQARWTQFGRLVALAPIPPTTSTTKSNKTTKFVHALGLQPLHSLSWAQLQAEKAKLKTPLLPNPYTDESYQRDHEAAGSTTATTARTTATTTNNNSNVGLSHASARRIAAEERAKQQSATTDPRWAVGGNKRRRADNDDDTTNSAAVLAPPPSPHATALFFHGLHRDVTGQLSKASTGDPLLVQTLRQQYGVQPQLPIRRPGSSHNNSTTSNNNHSRGPDEPTSSFCFVDFATHDQAVHCYTELAGSIVVNGVRLQVKWANQNNNNNNNPADTGGSATKRMRLTEAEAKTSTTVYFRLPLDKTTVAHPSHAKNLSSFRETLCKTWGETLRKWAEQTLEEALATDDDDDSPKITAEEEPALRVQLQWPEENSKNTSNNNPESINFGFLNFASHAAASMALATLTGSTDGGLVLRDAPGRPTGDLAVPTTPPTSNQENEVDTAPTAVSTAPVTSLPWDQVRLHWGRGKPAGNKEKDLIQDPLTGYAFSRQRFARDSRHDCWFCLASDACEKHLITGVYEHTYTAHPKGPVHAGHQLIVPVQHSSAGAFVDPTVATEVRRVMLELRNHADQTYDCDLFAFERAIQTKGGYHAHVQCIPIARRMGLKVEAIMVAQARKLGMNLKELGSDLSLTTVLSGSSGGGGDDDGNEDGSSRRGYFYAELFRSATSSKRFLYQTTPGGENGVFVPLQFGREVLALVLGKPELAHWKSSLTDHDQEAQLAADFRASFRKFHDS